MVVYMDPPSKGHLRVCAIYSEHAVLLPLRDGVILVC